MGKRGDTEHDSTQEVSVSQLVVPNPPSTLAPPVPPTSAPANDRSVWGRLVVGADDFVPEPKRPQAPRRQRTNLVVIGAVALALAGAALAVYWTPRNNAPAAASSKAASPLPTPAASTPTGTKAPAAPVAGSAPADAPAPLNVGDTRDPAIATPVVDAISGAGPPIKSTRQPKSKRTKKPAITKKPAAAKPN